MSIGAIPTAEIVKLDLAADLLRSSRLMHVRVLGTSMLPTIWPGDLLSIELTQPVEVAVGDIIRYMQGGKFVIHRVLEVRHADGRVNWITRGDSIPRVDEPVAEHQLVGKVTAIRRCGRLILPSRRLSPIARCFGRVLESFDLIPRAVQRLRTLLRDRHSSSEMARS